MAKPSNQIKDELKLEIIGFALLAFAILCLVGLFTEKAGAVGNFLVRVLKGTAGEGKYLLPVLIAFLGLKVMKERRRLRLSVKILGALALYLIILTLFHMQIPEKTIFIDGLHGLGGGIIGAILAFGLRISFGIAGSYIILSSLAIMAILVITNISLYSFLKEIGKKIGFYTAGLKEQLISFIYTDVEEEEQTLNHSEEDKEGPMIFDCNVYQEQGAFSEPEDMVESEEVTLPRIKIFPEPYDESQKPKQKVKEDGPVSPGFMNPHMVENGDQEIFETDSDQLTPPREYLLPSLGILARSLKLKNPRFNKDITENVRILEDTLGSFGIKAKVTQVSRGPAITRYELQPAPGVKVSRITSLSDDLALRLSATGVRIEAPIPGKDAVGIEVPNKEISAVVMREILESSEFAQFPSKLAVGLGKDIAGNPIIADLSKMPHLLIAGATGSGKSVCMNTLIASILFKAKPDEVKFLMIDPKMVELTTYNSIPHLIAPVVTDPKKAASALRWVVSEMENRYSLFANSGVKDVIRYNGQMVAKGEKPLPLVVVLIDELADLMMVAPADVEDAICRLAQMARAAGIHLVVATQRPSVDVITGLIKANIPSRISFAVSSQIDSRTILDMAGAEKLLGKGDMLFFPVGYPKPVRVQGAFMSDKEVEELVSFIKKQGKPEYQEVVSKLESKESSRDMEEDELLPDAVKIFIETGQASISMLQRRLRIGYSRAARLMDIMEQRGIVGGYEGSKPRSVLMSLEQYLNAFGE